MNVARRGDRMVVGNSNGALHDTLCCIVVHRRAAENL